MHRESGSWMLYVDFYLFTFNADEQKTAADRHGIERDAAEINQSVYFRNALLSKQKSKNIFVKWKSKGFREEVLLLLSQEMRGSRFLPGYYESCLIREGLPNLDG